MTAVADAPDLIDARLDALLAKFPPGDTAPEEFLGAQFDMGLAWIENPHDLGGLGLPPTLQRRVSDRLRAAGAPMLTQESIIAVGMAAPVLLAHGTDRQRARHLRPIFTGEEIWCQLFSEPGAGSDLAGLATSAVADGDEWVVNGQKVWTSFGDIATFGLLVARTDPTVPKHQGLTYFLLDMGSPGVEVRPLRQITGGHEFSEVFLTDVRLPDSNRVGEANRGWSVVVSTLMKERSALGDSSRNAGLSSIERAVAAWHAVPEAARDPARRDLLLRLWSRAEALRRTVQRVAADREGGTPGPDGSVPKLLSSLLEQQITEFVVNLQGASALLYEDDVAAREFLYTRMTTIAGGTSEILRNIIGERILGLPPDIQIDRDVPWRDVARDGSSR